MTRKPLFQVFAILLLTTAFAARADAKWWNSDWTIRKKIVIDTTPKGTPITQPVDSIPILIRLHDGNFQFEAAREDGSDLRFIADDDKTFLTYHIEKFDSLLGEAFVWVKVPGLKPDSADDHFSLLRQQWRHGHQGRQCEGHFRFRHGSRVSFRREKRTTDSTLLWLEIMARATGFPQTALSLAPDFD